VVASQNYCKELKNSGNINIQLTPVGVNSFTPLAVGGVLGHPTSAGGVLDYAKGNISQRDFFKLADTSGGLKGHTLKLFKPRNNTTV